VTKAEAFRFLNQASFGATESSANQLVALGDNTNSYARWIDAEIAKPASLLNPRSRPRSRTRCRRASTSPR
jgi:hypothetical protein